MKSAFVVASVLVTLSAFAAPPPKDLERMISEDVAPYVQHSAFSGVVLLGKGDDVIVNKAFGNANYEFSVPNTPDTRFAIASITKRFTFVIVTRLLDEKRLSLDDTLSKWAPDFPSADKITVSHLLHHKSGLRDPQKLRAIIRQNLSTADTVDALKTEKLGSVPGETYSYTTANFALLGYIIERVTGQTYASVVKKYVYDPAGMRDSGELSTTTVVPRLATGYMPDPFGSALSVCGPEDTSWKTGGGSSYSTTRDLMRFARAYASGKLLTVEERAAWPDDKLFGRAVARSNGSFPGANASLAYFPDDGVTVAVLSNNYSPVASTIARDVAAMYFGEKYTVPSVELAPGKPFDTRLTRSYALEGQSYTFDIVVRDNTPFVKWTAIRQEAMLPAGPDRWFLPLDFAYLTLRTDGSSVEGTMIAPWSDKPMKVLVK
jgi:CubicO group peptidase (beta-lactamase class C family)